MKNARQAEEWAARGAKAWLDVKEVLDDARITIATPVVSQRLFEKFLPAEQRDWLGRHEPMFLPPAYFDVYDVTAATKSRSDGPTLPAQLIGTLLVLARTDHLTGPGGLGHTAAVALRCALIIEALNGADPGAVLKRAVAERDLAENSEVPNVTGGATA
jgi:hypothetical protein